MDARVEEAMRLLREAGRLDLLADGVACRDCLVRQAASGVAAAVAACSPPRSSGGRRAPQVRSVAAGKVRAGRAGAPSRRLAATVTGWPAPLGARPPLEVEKGGAGGGIGSVPAAALTKTGLLARGPRSLGARPPKRGMPAGALQVGMSRWGFPRRGTGLRRAGRVVSGPGRVRQQLGHMERSRQVGGDTEQVQVQERVGGAAGGGEEDMLEEDGITLKVRPPLRTYGRIRSSKEGQVLVKTKGGDSVGAQSWGARGGVQENAGVEDGLLLTDPLEILQGEKSGRDEGDPGEPFAGSAPRDEEKAGPSTAGWIG
ncbi:hypothetical protein NDU88_003440 [Pleurodeles waltl]|uniref:Uncharacterized protein n=1 Tax=Pleurodeles waltl TaxID=8319 RepID=A0AAV7QCN9_PLEWA|nr:hypothetical protein NDU88_003440 [Pleurodeles waltl]